MAWAAQNNPAKNKGAIVGSKKNEQIAPKAETSTNQMGREALEGLRVSPKPAANSQQENQQTDHFPSRYKMCL